MSAVRFLLRTSLLSVFLSLALDWLYFTHYSYTETRTDCTQFKLGAGVDTNGEPFQVTMTFDSISTFTM